MLRASDFTLDTPTRTAIDRWKGGKAMFAAIVVEPAFLTGVGPRLAELPTITGHPYLSPYEDLKLKGR
jgi:hypothetical protein